MNNPLIAKQRILDAQESRRRTAAKREEEASEHYRAYREFFGRLALIAGGTAALSVTYLGYLKTLTSQPFHLRLLMASWLNLVVCVVTGTFYSYFHSSYMGFARGREYAQRLQEQHETIAEEIPNVKIADIHSKSDLDAYVQTLRDAAAARGKDVTWFGSREKVFQFLFRASAWIASVTFVLGLLLLLLFAYANILTSAKGN